MGDVLVHTRLFSGVKLLSCRKWVHVSKAC